MEENLARWTDQIAKEFEHPLKYVNAVADLLAEGATIPFISRYRKEMTGSMDEVMIANIRDRIEQLRELDKRREAIISSVEKQGKLTPELMSAIVAAQTLAELEDIYLPYKPKRKTKASVAREKGLEPLAQDIFTFKLKDVQKAAEAYINKEKGVDTVELALAGARDIMAEWMSENLVARKQLRAYWTKNSSIYSKVAKGKEQEGQKFKDYFEWSEKVTTAPSHRILAMFRGESEGILKVSIKPDDEDALIIMDNNFLKGDGALLEQAVLQYAYQKMIKK